LGFALRLLEASARSCFQVVNARQTPPAQAVAAATGEVVSVLLELLEPQPASRPTPSSRVRVASRLLTRLSKPPGPSVRLIRMG
jgi:hypothetical protein